MPEPRGWPFDPIHVPDDVWQRQEAALLVRDVGALFRLAKRYAGASQHRIATATGVPQSRVNALMNNRCGPVTSIGVLHRIADGLNLPDDARVLMGLSPRQVKAALGAGIAPGTTDDDPQPGDGDVVRPAVPIDDVPGWLAGAEPSAAEAMEDTRRAGTTEVGARTVEHLRLAIAEMAMAFAFTAPRELILPALWYRRHVATLLASSRHTLRERRELYGCAGWLSIILGWLSHDLGDSRTGEAYCLDAWEHGWQAEYREVCARAMDATATIALYANKPDGARLAFARASWQETRTCAALSAGA
jgi:transcriptional regulator with XRE-family HTH domain